MKSREKIEERRCGISRGETQRIGIVIDSDCDSDSEISTTY